MKLLITGAWREAERYIPQLAGHEVAFMPWEQDPLPVDPAWVEGVVCNGLFLHHPIETFPSLRFIQLTSAGTDRVPMAYIQERGIELHTAAGVYSVPMAEMAVSGLLQLYKKAAVFAAHQKEHRWEKHRELRELYGKTAVILGTGHTGRALAKRLQGFGCRMVGLNRTVRALPEFDEVRPLAQLEEMASSADILAVTIALTDETKGLVGANVLDRLPAGATVVNLARGGLVDEEALIRWLQQEENNGAVLDVFEREPLDENSPLWDMDNVILTPHNSFAGEGNGKRLGDMIRKSLEGV